MTTKNGHVLITPATCKDCKSPVPVHEDDRCPVCDYGLAICSLCGKVEIQLDEPCEFADPETAPGHDYATEREYREHYLSTTQRARA